MNYNKIILYLCWFIVPTGVCAQSNYESIKNKAIEDIQSGDFSGATSRLNVLQSYVIENNKLEYDRLLGQLQDSISNIYNRAKKLEDNKKYQEAIVEYQRLIGRSKEPLMKPLYANIGYCFEKLSQKELARNNYETGVRYEESLSALRLAWYFKNNKVKKSSEDMIDLYIKASNYYAAMDSLGVEYARIGQMNNSYKWFKKSRTGFSKYNMALHLIDPSISKILLDEYKKDDPILLLTESADDGYPPSQFYLGLLYYFAEEGERVKRDRPRGLELMKQAASSNYAPAKNMVRKINRGY